MRKFLTAMTGALVGLTVLLGIPTSAMATPPGPGHRYAGVYQSFTGTDYIRGLAANIWVAKPFVGANDQFSLMELAVQDANGSAVEVGWAANPAVFGDSKPRLFSCVWDGDTGLTMTGCWNGSGVNTGWFDNSSNATDLGSDLTTIANGCDGVSTLACVKRFQVKWVSGIGACSFVANGWEIDFDNQKVGCWMGNKWSQVGHTSMTNANAALAYAEDSYTGTGQPTTDLGNGQYGDAAVLSATGPAYIGSLALVSPNPSTMTANFAINPGGQDTAAYRVGIPSNGNGTITACSPDGIHSVCTFGIGGPGYKWNGTAWVTPGDIGS
jgi:hypothetical protein